MQVITSISDALVFRKHRTLIQNFTILSSVIPALDTQEENYWHLQFISLAVNLATSHKPDNTNQSIMSGKSFFYTA